MNEGRLYRSRDCRMIAGVAGGLAEYFATDVALIRLLLVLSVFLGGGGLLAYLIAWVIIPEEGRARGEKPSGEITSADKPDRPIVTVSGAARERRHRHAGIILVALGAILLVRQFLPWGLIFFSWPLLLIAVGLYLMLRSGKEGCR